ncbi:hypothetical protein MKY09_07485 [Psychrobacillus sp. FSL K6-4046]|uniref:hypothetical protein n=1 Tax=Psychrobacillus sp. FSL K6-4046 TaxID=2921550 RepID=UPI00315A67B5
MNELVSNKRNAYLIIGALVLLLLFAIYYFIISPLKAEKYSKEISVEVLQGEVASLKEQYNSFQASDVKVDNIFALESKVPYERELDELLLSLEQVELISDSKIEAIEFNNYDGILDQMQLEIYQEGSVEEEVTDSEEGIEAEEESESAEVTEGTVEEPPSSPVADAPLPANLKLITFNVSVQTKNYEHLVLLIEEIENLERVVRVDQITMNAPGEQELLNEESPTATSATIQLTTFFHKE